MVYIMHIKVRGARVFNEGYRNGVETKPGAVFRLPPSPLAHYEQHFPPGN